MKEKTDFALAVVLAVGGLYAIATYAGWIVGVLSVLAGI